MRETDEGWAPGGYPNIVHRDSGLIALAGKVGDKKPSRALLKRYAELLERLPIDWDRTGSDGIPDLEPGREKFKALSVDWAADLQTKK
jgi:hypothetical protein